MTLQYSPLHPRLLSPPMEYCGAKLSLQNDCSANYESVGMCLLRLYARASTASRRGTKEAAQSPCPCPISTRILIYRRRQFLRTVGRASPRHPQIAAETCLMWPRRITPTMRPPPTRLRWPSERRSFLGRTSANSGNRNACMPGWSFRSSAIPPLSGLAQSLPSDSRCGLWRPRPSGRPMASGTGCKSCIPVRAKIWLEHPDRKVRPGHAPDP